MKVKTLFLFLSLTVFFSCGNQEDQLVEKDLQNQDVPQLKTGGLCPPRINYPISFDDLAQTARLIDENSLDCSFDNIAYGGTSDLERVFNCAYNFPTNTNNQDFDCEDHFIQLYSSCSDLSFNEFIYFMFPSSDPVSSNPYYFQTEVGSTSSVFSQENVELMAAYANEIVTDLTTSSTYDFLDVEFFVLPADCRTLCTCNITVEDDEQTLTCGNNPVIYISVRICNYKNDDPIGIDPCC